MENNNEIFEQIGEQCLQYMKDNKDDFIKYFDTLTKSLSSGVQATLRILKDQKELMKDAKSAEEKSKIHKNELYRYRTELKKELPEYSFLLNDEIDNAFATGANAALCVISKDLLMCDDCPDCETCKRKYDAESTISN